MSDILSQEEVDALLRGVQNGDIETEIVKERSQAQIRPYDFSSRERIVRGRMAGLELTNERFTRLFRNSLSALISRIVEVSISKVEVTRFDDFMKGVTFPSSINIFKINPFKGYALLVLEPSLVFGLVEFFFGGGLLECAVPEERPFTAVEQRVIRKVVATALTDMTSAWNGIAEIHPEYIGSEMNPQMVSIVGQADLVILIELNVEIEEFKGKLRFCIPYAMVEPMRERLVSGIQSEEFEIDQRWAVWLSEMLKEARVEVSVELGKVMLTCEELLDLDAGKVINLGRPTSDDLPIRVEGLPKLFGQAGSCRGNQAIRVTRVCEKGEVDG
jgi:flagellar motor switch protein FliM